MRYLKLDLNVQQSGNKSTCWLETESNTVLCLRGSCKCSGETSWLARTFPESDVMAKLMLGQHWHASETMAANDSPLLEVFGSHHQKNKTKKNVVKVEPTMKKLSGSAHVEHVTGQSEYKILKLTLMLTSSKKWLFHFFFLGLNGWYKKTAHNRKLLYVCYVNHFTF